MTPPQLAVPDNFTRPRAIAAPRTYAGLETALALLLAVSIALIFWTEQRYPALLKKLHTGTAVQVKGAISFDALLPVQPQMPAGERVLRTTANWLWTNRFGMYFAIPFGAAMMTMMASAKPRRFRSAVGNVTRNTLCNHKLRASYGHGAPQKTQSTF